MLAMTQDRAEQDQRLSWVFESERRHLLAFIRRRIPDEIDAEDLLQEIAMLRSVGWLGIGGRRRRSRRLSGEKTEDTAAKRL